MTPTGPWSVSVVVPALEEAHEIEAALRSVGPAGTHEIVVVDGGSADDTVARTEALGVRVVQATRGRANQMNVGAESTTGNALIFLHADTWLPADWHDQVCAALDEGAVAGRFDVDLRGASAMLRVVAAAMNRRSRWSRLYTGDQAIFVRRAVFEAVGGFEAIPVMEDLALSKRLKDEGPIASLRAKVSTSGRRWETRGVLRTITLMWWLRFAYFVGVSPDRLARLYRAVR
ncbi:MAG: TIGR04283 family arsenosugar biosynthesis glycosyltransferase [Candidatus Binatia bacterium]|nr:TIGR04283 family arsenosugar biosynthesis glycosyltransferase [Candidatus Binatia bacterium]